MKHLLVLSLVALVWSGCQSETEPGDADGALAGGDGAEGGSGAAPTQTPADGGSSESGACCEPHPTPGCADPAVEECVCALRPECCSGSWDETCVQLLDEKRCEPSVRACVCEDWQQGQCCDGTWDTFCRVTAEEKCGAAPSCDTTDEPPVTGPKGPCCETGAGAGCAEPEVEACVCALLPDCCAVAWDSVCVQIVQEKHCQEGVRTCVCDEWQQSDCCSTQWTDFCETTAELKCGATSECG